MREHEKDLLPGIKIELLRRDDGASAEIGKRVARELITREHVNLVMGVVSLPVAAAIAPLATEAKVPFIITKPRASPFRGLALYRLRLFHGLAERYPLGKWAGGARLQESPHRGWKQRSRNVPTFMLGTEMTTGRARS